MNAASAEKSLVVAAWTALMLPLLLVGCSSAPPGKTWMDLHPTHGVNGECFEADDEPCDEDPYDLDDLFESSHSKKPSVVTTKKTPGPVKTTRRR